MGVYKYDFVILGGGFTGLYLSYLLMQQGYEVAILEKESSFGGLLRTIEYKGFKFDLGGHRLVFRDNKDLFNFLREIHIEDKVAKLEKKSKIFISNKFINYPPTLKDMFLFPPDHLKGILLDIFFRRYKFYKSNSFRDWLCFHYGETLYNMIFRDYSKKVWGLDCLHLPAHWLDRRVGKSKFINFLSGMPCIDSKDTKTHFYYPFEGIGMIISSLLTNIKGEVDIISGAKILEIFENNKGQLYKVDFMLNTGEKKSIFFNKIISTIPNVELIHSLPAKSFDKYLGCFQYRNIIFLNILLKSSNPITASHWTYLPSYDVIFSRIYEPKLWSKTMVLEEGNSLSLEIICGDDTFSIPKESLFNTGINTLLKLGLIVDKKIIQDYFVVRHKYAYPVLTNIEYLEKIKQYIKNRYVNLHLVGRMGNHSYYDIEDCVWNVKQLLIEQI